MELIRENIAMLTKMKQHLQELSEDVYKSPCTLLNQTSVGQHFRHIIEFYVCLQIGESKSTVCYDERKRDLLIEIQKDYAVQVIEEIIVFLNKITTDKPLVFAASYSPVTDKQISINTSLFRELAYALDHTIHHLAIIKIALADAGIKVDNEFGVAPSTLKYRNSCAQ